MNADINNIMRLIKELSRITETPGKGILRQAYSNEYRQGAELVKKEMEESGLKTYTDEIGNLFGEIAGTEEELPVIISGSHLDTVRDAGAYDGIAGVACALEAARMIQRSGSPLHHTYKVAGFIGEEGTHFNQTVLGSRFLTGKCTDSDMDLFKEVNGSKTMRQVRKEYGLDGNIEDARLTPEDVCCFIEVHGEQGPILEQAGINIGVVMHIAGMKWLSVKVKGQNNHAGTTPMNLRKDAGIPAYKAIAAVTDYVTKKYSGKATFTVGELCLTPGSSNCIPGECSFTADIRSGSQKIIDEIVEKLKEELNHACNNTAYEISELSGHKAVSMDPEVISAITKACKKKKIPYLELDSGAGHDSMIMADFCRTGMIFLPNKDGISHNPKEFISRDALGIGTEILYQTIRNIDEGK